MMKYSKRKFEQMSERGYRLLMFYIMPVLLAILLAGNAYAQEDKNSGQADKTAKKEIKTPQFIDEDGDGFNDLMPDSDGDGIPDMIDPDFKGQSAESLYMHRYMHGQTIEDERYQYQHMFQHGEPGQYGPNDSTGHGMHGGEGGGHHGGGGMDGPGGPGMGDDGGGMGMNAPQAIGGNPDPTNEGVTKGQDAGREKPGAAQQQQKPENEKGSGNQGGGGRP
jgi:hypothetical protein